MAKRQFKPRTNDYPAYPLELKTASSGHIYLRLEGGGWAWAGQRQGDRWVQMNKAFELLLRAHDAHPNNRSRRLGSV